MNSFCFEDKDPRIYKAKTSLALRFLSKGLFYIRAMPQTKYIHDIHFLPFAAFSGQRPAHLKTMKRRRRRYLAPMMMSKRIPKIM